MLSRILYPPVSFDSYVPLLPAELVDRLTGLARQFQNLRFVHLNSTLAGGGVAEILQSLVPMMNALGVTTERLVINPPAQFFNVTKKLHNLLQGADGALEPEELELYLQTVRDVSGYIGQRGLESAVWFCHDPQVLPLAQMLPQRGDEVRIWVCHIDLTAPNPGVLDQLRPLTSAYDGLIFSLDSYAPAGLDSDLPVYISPPAIDPLTAKNRAMSPGEAAEIVAAMGISPDRPLVTQVSRFDYWKDPWGVIDAYRMARESVPGLQLALLGLSQATDDPEALQVLNDVARHSAGDPDIHLYFDPAGLPDSIDRIVNAFQVASAVVMQKSTREGFGLTVAEAMWKGRPLIGGDVGGIRIQVEDGSSGYLVSSPQECARRMVDLLLDPALRETIGTAAKESVRRQFLLPRLALDYLEAAADLVPPARLSDGPLPVNGFADLEQLRIELPLPAPNPTGSR